MNSRPPVRHVIVTHDDQREEITGSGAYRKAEMRRRTLVRAGKQAHWFREEFRNGKWQKIET